MLMALIRGVTSQKERRIKSFSKGTIQSCFQRKLENSFRKIVSESNLVYKQRVTVYKIAMVSNNVMASLLDTKR